MSLSLISNALNFVKYKTASTNVTICEMTVAAAAPSMPQPNGYMKSQSRPTFKTAPTILKSIEYLGLPSALIVVAAAEAKM